MGALITLGPGVPQRLAAALSPAGRRAGPGGPGGERAAGGDRAAVAAANSSVSPSESIRVFRVLPEPFDVANGC
ncbi:hypothetical protein GCM10023238_37450 [Streptomyces heliomycini]